MQPGLDSLTNVEGLWCVGVQSWLVNGLASCKVVVMEYGCTEIFLRFANGSCARADSLVGFVTNV